jgi:hypothetical protein
MTAPRPTPPLEYASPWLNLAIPRVNTNTLAERGREVLTHLKQRGIALPHGNRLQVAISTIDRLNANLIVPTPEDPSACRATTEALRTLWEAFFIMHAALARDWHPNPFPNETLRYLLEGAPDASDDTNPLPRSKQFELYVAAWLATGRAEVRSGEPDLRLLYYGTYLGIAAKRLQTTGTVRLLKIMKEGGKQLAQQGMRGFVALNLDAYMDSLDSTAVGEDLGASFNASVAEAHRQMLRLNDRPAVIGVMLLGYRCDWLFGDGRPTLRWVYPFQVYAFSDLEPVDRFREYFETHFRPRLQDGLRTVLALVS